LTLSNGQYIWDIPGNVWEWTNDTITEANQPDVTAAKQALLGENLPL